jgi:hypothetical protein
MEPELQAIGHTANFATIAFRILIECLEKKGVLLPEQFQTALRKTIDHPKAERDRLDYQMLAELLKQLDGSAEPLH